MGELIYVGEVSIGVAIPLFLSLALQVELAIAGLIPQLAAKLAGYIDLQLRLSIKPPSLNASLDIAAKILASLQASIGFTLPSVNFTGELLLGLILQLKLQLAGLKALLDLALQIKGLAAAAGIKLFVYKGPLAHLGATLDAQVGVKASIDLDIPIYVPLFVVEASRTETVAALRTVLKTGE